MATELCSHDTSIRAALTSFVVAVSGLVFSVSYSNAQGQEKLGLVPVISQAPEEVRQSCQIVVRENGNLAANVGATKLTSTGYAGAPGRADITTTNGSYYVSVDRPNGFALAPNGGNSDVVFAASLSGRGKTNFAETPGSNRVKLKNGLTNIEIGLEVTKQQGAFPAGRYRAEITLRCE